MTHLMTAIVISGAMMVQLRNVRVAVMVLELGLRIKYFGFRSDSNLVIRPCCSCPSRPDSLRRVFSSVLIKAPFLLYPPAFCTSIFFLPDLAEISYQICFVILYVSMS